MIIFNQIHFLPINLIINLLKQILFEFLQLKLGSLFGTIRRLFDLFDQILSLFFILIIPYKILSRLLLKLLRLLQIFLNLFLLINRQTFHIKLTFLRLTRLLFNPSYLLKIVLLIDLFFPAFRNPQNFICQTNRTPPNTYPILRFLSIFLMLNFGLNLRIVFQIRWLNSRNVFQISSKGTCQNLSQTYPFKKLLIIHSLTIVINPASRGMLVADSG